MMPRARPVLRPQGGTAAPAPAWVGGWPHPARAVHVLVAYVKGSPRRTISPMKTVPQRPSYHGQRIGFVSTAYPQKLRKSPTVNRKNQKRSHRPTGQVGKSLVCVRPRWHQVPSKKALRKTSPLRVLRRSNQQRITGVVVNAGLAIPRAARQGVSRRPA